MTYPREVQIDLAAIRHNVEHLKEVVAPARVMTVVKANAYGHGNVEVARAALEAGTDWLGTAHIEEALALRSAGITAVPLLCWSLAPGDDFAAAIDADIQLGVSGGWAVREIARAAEQIGKRATVHLKADTGLGRNGISERDWPQVVAQAIAEERAGWLEFVGVFSHLAVADEPLRHGETEAAIAAFRQAVAVAEQAGAQLSQRHLANTPGAIDYPAARFDMVRIGLGTYGLSPFEDRTPEQLGLRPAMTWKSELINVKQVPSGQGVSYGYAFVADQPTTLGLVPWGYAEGVPRNISGNFSVSIRGRQFPAVGRVAMDHFVVDLADEPNIAVGEPVTLLGDGGDNALTAYDWAQAAGTINYEIVTRLGPRVRRTYIDSIESIDSPEQSLSFSITTASVQETQDFAHRLADALRPGDLLILSGELGAGKTAFTQGLARGLGIVERVTSPTFVVEQIYRAGGSPVQLVHIDAYRLGGAHEFDDLDVESLLPESVVVVEWGQNVAEQLSSSRLEIAIDIPDLAEANDETRVITVTVVGEGWSDRESLVSVRSWNASRGLGR